jgi:hypothetical protein
VPQLLLILLHIRSLIREGGGYALMSWFLNLPYYRVESILDMIQQLGPAERGIHKPGSVSRKQDSADPRLTRVITQQEGAISYTFYYRLKVNMG